MNSKSLISKCSAPAELVEYSRLYTRQVRWDAKRGCYVGYLPEIDEECCCMGDTQEEVYAQLDVIALGYTGDKALGRGERRVPEPGNMLVIRRSHFEENAEAGSEIAKLRRRLGLTQKDFAAILGVTGQTVSNWETGRKAPAGASAKLLQVMERTPEAVLR